MFDWIEIKGHQRMRQQPHAEFFKYNFNNMCIMYKNIILKPCLFWLIDLKKFIT